MDSTGDIKLHFEGVLEKAGKRFFEGFRKRWFILDGKDLIYYKAPEYTDENRLGTIDLSQVKSVTQTKVANNGFQISTRTRTYTFSAPTPELLADWLSVLRQAMQLKSFQSRKNLRAESFESQYEEVHVETRSKRSASAPPKWSEVSTEETNANLYESVGPAKKPPNSSWGEYELIPEAVPSNKTRTPKKASGTVDKTTVVGAPSSVTASSDPAYDLVGAASTQARAGSAPAVSGPPRSEYDLVGAASEPVVSSGISQPASEPRPDTAPPTYATVKRPNTTSSSEGSTSTGGSSDLGTSEYSSAEMSGSILSSKHETGEVSEEGGADNLAQYAQVCRSRSKSAPVEVQEKDESDSTNSLKGALPTRYGSLRERVLSVISEDADQYDQESEAKADAALIPCPTIGNSAITEMKKFLARTEQEETGGVKQGEGSQVEDESMVIGNGSAFELLKQLLQRLDSQEAS